MFKASVHQCKERKRPESLNRWLSVMSLVAEPNLGFRVLDTKKFTHER